MRSITAKYVDIGDADSQEPATAWWRWGSAKNWATPTAAVGQSGLPITADYWSWPIYEAASANGRLIRVWRNPALWDEPARWSTVPNLTANIRPAVVPYGITWQQGKGTDQGILIDDDATGICGWEMLNCRPANWFEALQINVRTWGRFRAGDFVCDQLARRTPLSAGTYEGRGAGRIPKRSGILTARAVLAGDIGTAVSMVGYNVQYGDGATFVAPATRVEHRTAASLGPTAKILPPGADVRMMPHGTRLRITLTNDEIEAWLNRRNLTGAKRRSAFVIAAGLRDYGWVCLETGTGNCQLESEGTMNPEARERWKQCGLVTPGDFATLLDGLLDDPYTVKVVRPV